MVITIFDLNCWLLPPPFAIDNRKRLSKIIEFIGDLKPEIISLQEVWLLGYVQKLKKSLPDYNFTYSDSKIFNKSGLLTGTTLSYKSSKQVQFSSSGTHSFVERFVKKSYYVIEFSHFTFINTHLYAPTNREGTEKAQKQINEINKLANNKDVILAGDLNIEQEELMQIGLGKTFRFDNTYGVTVSDDNAYTRARMNKYTDANKKLDYVLATKNRNLKVRTKLIDEPVMSDHYAVVGEIVV